MSGAVTLFESAGAENSLSLLAAALLLTVVAFVIGLALQSVASSALENLLLSSVPM